VNFDPIWSYPKPFQKPHPPIILGTLSAKGLSRVANYCDGWIPVGAQIEDIPAAIKDLHARAQQAGREPSEVPVSIFSAPDDEAVLGRYQDMGIERAVLGVPSKGAEAILPLLDTYAAHVTKFA
jgi:alkanesulfonate monooxygenase SsuD/methylene tetrahydromethanopterin reductase-like flavin-dependent oxidoreductase (luciferase family)